jgi:hypothetical protein
MSNRSQGHGNPCQPYFVGGLVVLPDKRTIRGMADNGDIALESLRRRMRAVQSLYRDATATMDASHVNHVALPGMLPIAFSLFHIVNMIDVSIGIVTGKPALWNDSWAERVKPAINDHGKHRTVGEMMHQRIGDYPQFVVYMNEVFLRLDDCLTALTPEDLGRILVARPLPPQVASTFSARVAGPEGISVLDALECWIYQHALRHMGEIELSRGALGLGGMTS